MGKTGGGGADPIPSSRGTRKSATERTPKDGADPILSLRGTGRKTWAGEDADAYVARLRKGWR